MIEFKLREKIQATILNSNGNSIEGKVAITLCGHVFDEKELEKAKPCPKNDCGQPIRSWTSHFLLNSIIETLNSAQNDKEIFQAINELCVSSITLDRFESSISTLIACGHTFNQIDINSATDLKCFVCRTPFDGGFEDNTVNAITKILIDYESKLREKLKKLIQENNTSACINFFTGLDKKFINNIIDADLLDLILKMKSDEFIQFLMSKGLINNITDAQVKAFVWGAVTQKKWHLISSDMLNHRIFFSGHNEVLYEAAKDGQWDLVVKIATLRPQNYLDPSSGETFLHLTIRKAPMTITRQLLDLPRVSLLRDSRANITPFELILGTRNWELIYAACLKLKLVKEKEPFLRRPLIVAFLNQCVGESRWEVVTALLMHTNFLKEFAFNDFSLLHHLLLNNQIDYLKQLITADPDIVNTRFPNNQLPLLILALTRSSIHKDTWDWLISYPNLRHNIFFQNQSILKWLADADTSDDNYKTKSLLSKFDWPETELLEACMFAAEKGNFLLVSLVLRRSKNPGDLFYKLILGLLSVKPEENSWGSVKKILSNLPDIINLNFNDYRGGDKILEAAIEQDQWEIIALLLKFGGDNNYRNCLEKALIKEKPEVVKKLIELDTSLDKEGSVGIILTCLWREVLGQENENVLTKMLDCLPQGLKITRSSMRHFLLFCQNVAERKLDVNIFLRKLNPDPTALLVEVLKYIDDIHPSNNLVLPNFFDYVANAKLDEETRKKLDERLRVAALKNDYKKTAILTDLGADAYTVIRESLITMSDKMFLILLDSKSLIPEKVEALLTELLETTFLWLIQRKSASRPSRAAEADGALKKLESKFNLLLLSPVFKTVNHEAINQIFNKFSKYQMIPSQQAFSVVVPQLFKKLECTLLIQDLLQNNKTPKFSFSCITTLSLKEKKELVDFWERPDGDGKINFLFHQYWTMKKSIPFNISKGNITHVFWLNELFVLLRQHPDTSQASESIKILDHAVRILSSSNFKLRDEFERTRLKLLPLFTELVSKIPFYSCPYKAAQQKIASLPTQPSSVPQISSNPLGAPPAKQAPC